MAGGCCWHAAAATPLQLLLQGSCHYLRGGVDGGSCGRPGLQRCLRPLVPWLRCTGRSCHISLPLEWWPATAVPNFSIAVGPRGFFLSSVRSMQHTTCQGPVTSTRLAGLCGAHWSSTAAATRGCVAELAAGQARQAAAAAASSCKPALPLFAPRVLPPHACCLMCTSALHKRLWVGAI